MRSELERVLLSRGMEEQDALACAGLFAQASLDGVYTHGLNRFPVFVDMIDRKLVDVGAKISCVGRFGCMERWDGHMGPGNLNARAAMDRAIALAKEQTIGCVALARTNHWMRAGSYGLQAADAGCIGILWTNTMPNLPPWGSAEAKLGNNPVVIAVPHADTPVLVDVAMSLFSYGKMQKYRMEGEKLPFEGGYDKEGNLTDDPTKILKSLRPLPIGYWKGSGLSLALDLVAAALSGGQTVHEVGKLPVEAGISQVFVAIDLDSFPDREEIDRRIAQTLEDLHASTPVDSERPVRFPGEGMLQTRAENLERGIPVEQKIWDRVRAL
jgi:3-dehydro-L-gulonate 2-dehydrogenase